MHNRRGPLSVTVGFVVVLLTVLAGPVSDALAGPITIEKVTEKFDPKTKVYTYTVVIKNTGNVVVDYTLTAQPYNDKDLDANEKPKDAARKQTKKINIGGFQKSTYTFEFTGAEGKDWKFKYTDLYDKNGKFVTGDVGSFSFLQLPPAPSLAVLQSFPYPFPGAVAASYGHEADFFVDITDQKLPPGWSLSGFDPAPGTPFTFSFGQSQPINVAFASTVPTSVGDIGFVGYDFVQPDTGFRFHAESGVEVIPEPLTWVLFGFGLGLLGCGRRKSQGPEAD